MSKKEKPKTFDELWEELKNDKEYGDQIRFIDRVVNQDKENEKLKHQLAEKEKELTEEKNALNWYQKDYANQMEELAKELAEKDKEIERLKENQTPTDKELKPQEYDNYNLADKLRYRDSQVRIVLERLQKLDDELLYARYQICKEIKELL